MSVRSLIETDRFQRQRLLIRGSTLSPVRDSIGTGGQSVFPRRDNLNLVCGKAKKFEAFRGRSPDVMAVLSALPSPTPTATISSGLNAAPYPL